MATRRTFLRTSSVAAATALTPWRLNAARWPRLGLLDPSTQRTARIVDPDLKMLAQRALDAATAAGATYADVRFTTTRRRQFSAIVSQNGTIVMNPPQEARTVGAGVRALTRGSWGFMADTEVTPEMMAWLGHTAADIGKTTLWSWCPPIELGGRPPVAVGNWQMPVKRDPFAVSDAEHYDFIKEFLSRIRTGKMFGKVKFNYTCQDRTFASTDGAFTTQTVYTTFSNDPKDPTNDSQLVLVWGGQKRAGADPHTPEYTVPQVSPCGMGYEVFEDQKFFERIPEWAIIAEDLANASRLDAPGRFETVFDAQAMATITRMMGTALEVDRAFGYEANAGGTSYLSPVQKMLGTSQFPVGVTVTANRTQKGGAATVQWDDEGVASQDYTLIEDGKLVDYATSREFVPELSRWYQGHGQTTQSRGCAGSGSALSFPLVQTPNLKLHPGKKDLSFEELLAGIDDGMAVVSGDCQADQQQLNAIGDAVIYRVKKGKLARAVHGSRFMIRVPNLWNDLVTLGGERSAGQRGFTRAKGEPNQFTVHSVDAVAARFRDVIVRDFTPGG